MNAITTTCYTPAVALEIPAWVKEVRPATKAALLMLAAPFLGLAFVIALPLAGLACLAWVAAKAVAPVVKRIALFAAAPIVGLVYVIAFPFVGLGVLAYYAVHAARN